MTRWLGALLALVTLAPVSAFAANEAAVLAALRQEQAGVYAIVREFHMQTLLSGDPTRTSQLKAAVAQGQAAVKAAAAGTGDAAAGAAIARAAAAWAPFAKLALGNNITRDGYTDDNLVGDLYVAAATLDQALAAAITAVPGGQKRAQADKAHAANLLMQRTAAAYLKRAAQMSPDIGAEDTFDIGDATRRLDAQMNALARELKGNATMASALTKWNFIRGSLANYNEKSVPFIVDRYATQINDSLQQVVAGLEGTP